MNWNAWTPSTKLTPPMTYLLPKSYSTQRTRHLPLRVSHTLASLNWIKPVHYSLAWTPEITQWYASKKLEITDKAPTLNDIISFQESIQNKSSPKQPPNIIQAPIQLSPKMNNFSIIDVSSSQTCGMAITIKAHFQMLTRDSNVISWHQQQLNTTSTTAKENNFNLVDALLDQNDTPLQFGS